MELNEIRKFIVEHLMPHSFKILKKYFNSKRLGVRSKGYVDIVTRADIENEEFLKSQLLGKYPETTFLGEETSSLQYREVMNKVNLWVVDPLDGTVNYSRGQENFAVSIALVNKGQTELGVVGIPMRHQIFWAQKDINEAFNNSGIKMRTSDISDISKSSLRCDWVYDAEVRRKTANLLRTIAPRVRQLLTGGSGVADMLDVALGKVDIYFNPGLNPWDIAAACFIVKKAGGKVTSISGGRWNVFEPNLVVSNGKLHDKFLEFIQNSRAFQT